jgi:hypothetical protein
MANHAETLERELAEKTNEVARLRELLNKTCDIIEYSADLLTEESRVDTANRFRAKITAAPDGKTCEGLTDPEARKRYAALAPAPEEPVIQDFRTTELRKSISSAINSVSAENGSDTPDFILAAFLTDCLEAWNTATKRRNDWYAPKGLAPAPEEPVIKESLTTEPAPKWRDLGPDEVIQEGDEWYAKFHNLGSWHKADPWHIDHKPSVFNFSFRTRRPLPKQEPDEVARLKAMVMDAARRGDEMAAHWKERAEKAEAIIQQLHHFAGIIEGFQTTTTK